MGRYNIAIGNSSLGSNTDGERNTSIGYASLYGNYVGCNNSALGYHSLYLKTSGNNNTAIGDSSGYFLSMGHYNIFLGSNAGPDSAASLNNTLWISSSSGIPTIYGDLAEKNVGLGTTAPTNRLHIIDAADPLRLEGLVVDNSITDVLVVDANGVVHKEKIDSLLPPAAPIALDDLTDAKTETSSIFIGSGSGVNNGNRKGNTALGDSALYYNGHGTIDQATNNTAIGSKSLFSNTLGTDNTAGGYFAMYQNTSGEHNTAFGNRSLSSNTDGDNNTAAGSEALKSNTLGIQNSALGATALSSNTLGIFNTASGYGALSNNTTGNCNTADGVDALYTNATGDYNTAIGYRAGPSFIYTNLSNSGAFGYYAMTSADNQYRIGNGNVTSIGGNVTWTSLSDGRFKFNVAEDVKGLDFIMRLRPVTYQMNVNKLADFLGEDLRYDEKSKSVIKTVPDEFIRVSREEKSKIRYTGFIAQEVETTAKEIGYDFSGVDAPQNDHSNYGLRYAEFVVPLVKAVQEQQSLIEQLNKRIDELESKLNGNPGVTK